MADQVLDRLDSIEQALRQTDRPLTFNEAATFLSCSKSYLYKLTHQRAVPCYKPMGKKLFFKRQELEGFLFQRPVRTREALEQEAVDHVAVRKGGAPC